VTDRQVSAARPWLAWAGLGLMAALAVVARLPLPGGRRLEWVLFLAFGVFAGVGGLVLTRRRGHPIGRLMMAIGLIGLTAAAAQNYAYDAYLRHGGVRPGAGLAAWVGEMPWGLLWALFVVFVLLFPNGQPLSPRWGVLTRFVGGVGATSLLLYAVMLWPLRDQIVLYDVREEEIRGVFALLPLAFLVTGLCLLAAAVGFALRYRRSVGAERAQLKWFAFACVLSPLILLEPLLRDGFGIRVGAWGSATPIGILAIPVAAGVAILRYRLYDIDRVISRTVSYALITGVLIGVYAGGVFLLSPVVAGLGGGSELAVAAATLAVAGAFGPVRRRVQGAVDRRFNRARYDAQQLVEAFQHRLRDEVDLGELHAVLVDTVDQTVEPAHASLWLRPAGADHE
jgi:hypothetical protein